MFKNYLSNTLQCNKAINRSQHNALPLTLFLNSVVQSPDQMMFLLNPYQWPFRSTPTATTKAKPDKKKLKRIKPRRKCSTNGKISASAAEFSAPETVKTREFSDQKCFNNKSWTINFAVPTCVTCWQIHTLRCFSPFHV